MIGSFSAHCHIFLKAPTIPSKCLIKSTIAVIIRPIPRASIATLKANVDTVAVLIAPLNPNALAIPVAQVVTKLEIADQALWAKVAIHVAKALTLFNTAVPKFFNPCIGFFKKLANDFKPVKHFFATIEKKSYNTSIAFPRPFTRFDNPFRAISTPCLANATIPSFAKIALPLRTDNFTANFPPKVVKAFTGVVPIAIAVQTEVKSPTSLLNANTPKAVPSVYITGIK